MSHRVRWLLKQWMLTRTRRRTKNPIIPSLGLHFLCHTVSRYVYFSLREGDPDKLAYV